jgi:HlyD family secretion protein
MPMTSLRSSSIRGTTNRRESGRLFVILTALVIVAGIGVSVAMRMGLGGEEESGVRGATVQRGPMRISVIERGNLKAADSVALKSEIEGQTTILKLVPEGTMVEAGDVLCELDATELIDERFQQEISVRNAEAAYVKSKQNHRIQESQNDSDIKTAEQALRFAEIDLRKFQEGEKLARIAEADEAIKLGEEEYTRAGNNLEWSTKLNEKGFLTDTELEADRLSLSRTEIQREQAKRDKDLLVRFQLPRDEADLTSKLEEAARELERVKLQAAARIVDYEADMDTNEAKLRLEREKLQKHESQIAKSKLIAPRAGMVVYAVEEGGRYGNSQPIKEGTQVRERQEIVTIPSAAGMIAQVSLHESVLKQVEAGQKAIVKVDALPGREFHGQVHFVSVMADQQSFWANPNLRLYRTEVTIDDAVGEMRPGMSCAIEILVEEIDDTLFVPVQSIFRRGSQNLAFVEKGNDSEEREVEVGRYNDRWVQVLAGLTENETVLLAAPANFSRESEEDTPSAPSTEGEGHGPALATPGATGAPVDDGGVHAADARRGERGERGPGENAAGPGREGGTADAAREEARKRFEGMSEEERAKAMESFRGRRGEGGGGGEDRPRRDSEGKGG